MQNLVIMHLQCQNDKVWDNRIIIKILQGFCGRKQNYMQNLVIMHLQFPKQQSLGQPHYNQILQEFCGRKQKTVTMHN